MMGISTPKKPFNLVEFLAEKGKPRPMRKTFRYRSATTVEDEATEAPAAEGETPRE